VGFFAFGKWILKIESLSSINVIPTQSVAQQCILYMTHGSLRSCPVVSIEGLSTDYADKYRFHPLTSGTRLRKSLKNF